MFRRLVTLTAAGAAATLVLAVTPTASAAPDPGDVTTAADRFGVREIYPTKPGGRQWFLPADATKSDGEWSDGEMHFKKEISHTAGYTGSRDKKKPFASGVPTNQWFGFKTVIRNVNNNTAVRMENWLDRNADGNWQKINTVTDSGGWTGGAGLASHRPTARTLGR